MNKTLNKKRKKDPNERWRNITCQMHTFVRKRIVLFSLRGLPNVSAPPQH
jgi:hypothetical protein